jgi:S-adenosylmethionine:tRNA ribosyltransferase-isomerase
MVNGIVRSGKRKVPAPRALKTGRTGKCRVTNIESSCMNVDEFDYQLPPELIAQRPLQERDTSRMMVVDRTADTFADRTFRDLPAILQPGDLLVLNNTRVFPARLLGRRKGVKAQSVGKYNPARRQYLTAEIEILLVRHEDNQVWQALVHPGRKVPVGEVINVGDDELEAEVLSRGEHGLRRVRLRTTQEGTVEQTIDRLGHVPLPPYIRRTDNQSDREAYQTLYAKARGAVAAPTAGLHFTRSVFEALRARGVETCEVTLHVGLGTFRPVRTDSVEDHKMDAEQFEVSQPAAAAINLARREGRRIVAVGTTSVRTLEHVARRHAGRILAGGGEADLFIVPGFQFQVIGGLLTNFHLPRSTLLMLVSAFGGLDLITRAYQHAIEQRYRFYSYGDCMLIL